MITRHPSARSLALLLAFAAAVSGRPAFAAAAETPPARERLSFNTGWRFTRDDPDQVGGALAYERVQDWVLPTGDDLLNAPPLRAPRPGAQPGGNVAWLRPDFDDSGWRRLDLPHDWGIEGPFMQELPGSTGKLPWAGVGWYRKHFDAPASDAGRQIYLDIDGAMSYAMVWLNGRFAGGWPYGYTSWRADLTPFIKPGEKNTLVIRLDNPRESSRWYPGSGIYRNVWLVKTAPVHVAQWGVFVTTPVITADSATVDVAVTLDNKSAVRASLQVAVRLYAADAEGRPVGEPVATGAPRAVRLLPGRQAAASLTLAVASPRLWSLRERHRYVAETIVTAADGENAPAAVIDRVETPFGIRKINTDPARGFFLNGGHIPIRGVCLHHDLGALGAAVNLRALERQLEILQAMGCNAVRTSHNPPAPEFLELCDRMGMLVMDETFDCWAMGKKRDDYSRVYADWHEKDVRALIRRDRNHPSVVMWSIGNEVREQYEVDGWKTAAHLAAIVREEDRTRPVTAGFNNFQAGYSGFQNVFEVFGYNYKPRQYGKFHADHPHIPLIGAETISTMSSRGEYFFPVTNERSAGRYNYQVSSYDFFSTPWANTPDVEFRGQEENPSVLGEFVWTGFDYIGEPTPYNADVTNLLNYSDPAERARAEKELAGLGKIRVPSRSSYFGIIDLAGFPKDRYYLYQSHWRPGHPMAHILPHWNWPDRGGQVTPVHVYGSGDEAELFLNGKSQGRRKRAAHEYRFHWNEVVYEPGELKVVTWKNGRPWAEAVTRTTGPAAKLTLAADRARLRADGRDLSFVTVAIADAEGRPVPRSKNKIRFRVTGPAEIAATDNGDATDHTSFQSPERRAYNALALVILRAKPGEPGEITLRAESEGLAPAEIILQSR
jgi:beta-galactosidase